MNDDLMNYAVRACLWAIGRDRMPRSTGPWPLPGATKAR